MIKITCTLGYHQPPYHNNFHEKMSLNERIFMTKSRIMFVLHDTMSCFIKISSKKEANSKKRLVLLIIQ